MKTILRHAVLLLLINQLINVAWTYAQTISLIPEVEQGHNYTGFMDARQYASTYQPVIFKGSLYSMYTDPANRGRLAKFNGTSVTLLPNPDDGYGFTGNQIVFNDAIYCQYRDANYVFRLARFDGNNFSLLPNPDNGWGHDGFLAILDNTLYSRYLDANSNCRLAKISTTNSTATFAIVGVSGISCMPQSDGKNAITFTPQYTGLTGQSVTFSVTNELPPTTAPGPYTLNLYSDNPAVTLKARQEGTTEEASYVFNWKLACGSLRQAATETLTVINIKAIPNPVSGQTVDIEVQGAGGQLIIYQVVSERGYPISQLRVEKAEANERQTLRLGNTPGTYIVKVSTLTQVKALTVIKQ
ncbi:T9SS type A sorting domain-containing protein [Spirosoma aureum]|uniref:T9SS type A sorting domain-containing protein n=1 Tax=Spirosoma aureum TaxID=2692134 RepID=A0A6G9APE1_9BACT|nr:T9SS type A sorting domain-containing protein [Spirosoma aureum]QIP14209.1 T9SS type A sorting domain-containing protein [Spirosoma aureum]